MSRPTTHAVASRPALPATVAGRTTREVLRRSVATWPRRCLLAGTLLLGVAAAVVVATAVPSAERTFAGYASLVQLLMSVTVPFLGVLIAATTAADPWRDAGTVAVGSVLVQVVAQWVGTGAGLLLRSPALACLTTIVVPPGLWAVLGAVDVLRPAQGWLVPFVSAQHALSGRMSPLRWAQWFVVALVWGLCLNAGAAAWLRRRQARS